jgi:hypothetical protein
MNDLPDVYAEQVDDAEVVIVANKKARRLINKRFVGGRLPWSRIDGSEYLASPEDRAVGFGVGPLPDLILSNCHQAGLSAAFHCRSCDDLHFVDDAMAERFVRKAEPFAVTLQ